MKFYLLSLLAITLGLSACGMKENPLDGKSAGVTQAEPKSDEQKPQADRADFLNIFNSEAEFSFLEDQSSQYAVTGASTEPTVKFAMQIINLNEFPGATFDPVTGVFDWKPSLGFLVDYTPRRLALQVRIFTTNLATTRSTDKLIPVVVSSGEKKPSVLKISYLGSKSIVREGEFIDFDVQVSDVTGLDDTNMRPNISFMFDDLGGATISDSNSLIKLRSENPNIIQDLFNPSLWTFKLRMDLKGKELTPSVSTFQFKIKAISRFKVVSAPYSSSITVVSNLSKPMTTWVTPQEMKAGQKNNFTYTVFDPKGEGDVQLSMRTRCGQVHPNLKCGTCLKVSTNSLGDVLTCPITWDIPADYFANDGVDKITLEMFAFLKSKISGDAYVGQTADFSGVIKVLPADKAPANISPESAPKKNNSETQARGN